MNGSSIISLIVVGFLVASCKGSLESDVAPRPRDQAVGLDAMRKAYGAIRNYEDSGEVSFTSSSGDEQTVAFSTAFERPSKLLFTFHHVTPSATGDPLGKLWVDGSGVHTDYLGTSSEPQSVDIAAHELQGVSRLSSLIVPELLFGRDPWADLQLQMESSTTEVVGGRKLSVVRFSSTTTGTTTTLWLSENTRLLERLQIDQRKGGHGFTDIKYKGVKSAPP